VHYFPALFAVVILIAVVVSVIDRYRQRRIRTEGMRRTAEEMGLAFWPKADADSLTAHSSFELFTAQPSTAITNLMRGVSNDLEVWIFDFGQRARNGKRSHRIAQTVLYFNSPDLALPAFLVRPKHISDRIATLFGRQDIAVDGHATFSKNHLLQGQDEEAVRRLFDDEVVSYFERGSSLWAEGREGQLLLCRRDKLVEPEQVRFLLQEGFELLSLCWPTSSRRGEKLPDDFRQRFGVRVAGDVRATADRHATGIRQSLQ
jgi:hypothetical protein